MLNSDCDLPLGDTHSFAARLATDSGKLLAVTPGMCMVGSSGLLRVTLAYLVLQWWTRLQSHLFSRLLNLWEELGFCCHENVGGYFA